MSAGQLQGKIKLDLGEVITRAIRVRAGLDGVDPRDVVIAALEMYIPDEIATVKAKLSCDESSPAATNSSRSRKRSGSASQG